MIYLKKCILAGLALSCLYLSGITGTARSEPSSSEPLARIDKKEITVGAFKAELTRRSAPFYTPEQKEALLEDMVRFELAYGAALGSGYDKDPDVLERLKRLIVNKYRKDVLEPRLEKITVADEDIEGYYQTHKDDFATPAMVRAAIIRITVPARASKEKKAQLFQRAGDARAEALKLNPATRSFGPVAVKYSDHQPTRYRGGDTGRLQAGGNDRRWPKEVNQAIFSLAEPGKISPVITTPTGHYLIKLMESKKSAPRPLATVREQIRHQLLRQKQARVEHEFYQALKGKVTVKVDRARLATIEPTGGGSGTKSQIPPSLPGQ